MKSAPRITGIILAGGESSRMGADKGLVRWQGKPLAEHMLETVSKACNHVLFISNQPGYGRFGKSVFKDIFKKRGPAGGLHSGLMHSETPFNLLVACDMPYVTSALLQFLIENISGREDAIVPLHNNRPEPLCAVYSKNCIPALEQSLAEEKLKMQEVIKNFNTRHVVIDDSLSFYAPRLFANFNTPAELENHSF